MSKGATRDAAWATVRVRHFDLVKCLGSQCGRSARALLLASLVRAHVQEEGGAPLPMHADAAVPLIQDVAGLGLEHDVAQLLRSARGLRVVDYGSGGCRVEVEEKAGAADGRGGDGGLVEGGVAAAGHALEIAQVEGNVASDERMMDEIGGCMTVRRRAGAGGKSAWRLAPRVIELDAATLANRIGRDRYPCTNALCACGWIRWASSILPQLSPSRQWAQHMVIWAATTRPSCCLNGRCVSGKKSFGLYPPSAGTRYSAGIEYGLKGQEMVGIEKLQALCLCEAR
jgi:hypothetical protein